MKNFLDEDLRFGNLKNFAGGIRARDKSHWVLIILAVIGFFATAAAVAYVILKFCKTSDEYEFDDFDYDEHFDDEDIDIDPDLDLDPDHCLADEEDFEE